MDIFTEIKRTHIDLARKASALRRTSFLWGMALGHAKGVETPDVQHLEDLYFIDLDQLVEEYVLRTPGLFFDGSARDRVRRQLSSELALDFQRGLDSGITSSGLTAEEWHDQWCRRSRAETEENERIEAEFARIAAHFDDLPPFP